MSKGKIDRILCAQFIVHALKQSDAVLQNVNATSTEGRNRDRDRDRERDCQVTFKNVSYHEKSAHIQVQLLVSFELDHILNLEIQPLEKKKSANAIQISKENTTCTEPNASKPTASAVQGKGGVEVNANVDANVDVDIIREFIRSNYKSQLTKEQEDALAPPYKITVRSIPSEISGCMPEVHRLYCKYQHAIHGDDDPYSYQQEDGLMGGTGSSSDPSMDASASADGRSRSASASASASASGGDSIEMANDSNSSAMDDSEDQTDDEEYIQNQMLTEEKLRSLYPEYDKDRIKKIYKGYVPAAPAAPAVPVPAIARVFCAGLSCLCVSPIYPSLLSLLTTFYLHINHTI